MASYVTDAIVLSARRYGEADRLLTILTLEKGKLGAIAKSARKPKSRIRGATEPFIQARFELAEGKSLDIVRQAEIIDPHLGLRESWHLLQLAGHVSEITGKMCEERVPDSIMYDLLSEALNGISNAKIDAVVRFKAGLLDHMGVYPDLSGCAVCGSERVKGAVHLDKSQQGFVCSDCAEESGVNDPVPMKALYFLHALHHGDEPDDALDSEMLDKVDDILTSLLQSFLQLGFKTSSAARHARNSGRKSDNISNKDNDIKSGPDNT